MDFFTSVNKGEKKYTLSGLNEAYLEAYTCAPSAYSGKPAINPSSSPRAQGSLSFHVLKEPSVSPSPLPSSIINLNTLHGIISVNPQTFLCVLLSKNPPLTPTGPLATGPISLFLS